MEELRERDILFYQLLMLEELLKLWDCTLQEFAELEKYYDLFPWIRYNYLYLQGYDETVAAEDIDHYVREERKDGPKPKLRGV